MIIKIIIIKIIIRDLCNLEGDGGGTSKTWHIYNNVYQIRFLSCGFYHVFYHVVPLYHAAVCSSQDNTTDKGNVMHARKLQTVFLLLWPTPSSVPGWCKTCCLISLISDLWSPLLRNR